MQIEVRTFHLAKNSWVQGLIESYLKKITPYEKIEFKVVKDEKKLIANHFPESYI